jgi:hypothetical protein
MKSEKDCPNPGVHGNPFRYCPHCDWHESTAETANGFLDEGAKRTNDIENRFSFHPADTDTKRQAHESIRAQCRTLAHYWTGALPEGREKSLAITKLEEAMMWANAAIARNGGA